MTYDLVPAQTLGFGVIMDFGKSTFSEAKRRKASCRSSEQSGQLLRRQWLECSGYSTRAPRARSPAMPVIGTVTLICFFPAHHPNKQHLGLVFFCIGWLPEQPLCSHPPVFRAASNLFRGTPAPSEIQTPAERVPLSQQTARWVSIILRWVAPRTALCSHTPLLGSVKPPWGYPCILGDSNSCRDRPLC
jgi:hypothetical protein